MHRCGDRPANGSTFGDGTHAPRRAAAHLSGRISTLRNSTGWLSACSEIQPPLSIFSPLANSISALASLVAVVELGFVVFEHRLAVDDVLDVRAADLDLDRHPLVAVEGLRLGVDAVFLATACRPSRRWCRGCRGCRWCARPCRGRRATALRSRPGSPGPRAWWPGPGSGSSRRCCGWPSRAAGALLADEAVFGAEPVALERRLVEQVAELARRTSVYLS